MDELACEYDETHDRKIVDQLYELAELEKIDKVEVNDRVHARGPALPLQPCRASVIALK